MNNPHKDQNFGFTLIELIIAAALVVVVMAAAFSLSFANNQWYVVAIADSELMREMNLALDHLQKQVRAGFKVTIDVSANPQKIRISNKDETVWSLYQWDDSSDELWFYPDETNPSVKEVVASKMSLFMLSYLDPDGDQKIDYFTVLMKVTGTWGSILTKETTLRENIGARSFQGVVIRVS